MARLLIVLAIVATIIASVLAQRSSVPRTKPGKCPDTSGVITTCELDPNSCRSDTQCPGNQLCCSSGCNIVCMDPEQGSVTTAPVIKKPKPGTCPPPTGIGLCADTCKDDHSCPGANKCCTGGCGALACTPPNSRPITRPVKKPGSCPPSTIRCFRSVCHSDSDCSGDKKCCSGNCLCSSPILG